MAAQKKLTKARPSMHKATKSAESDTSVEIVVEIPQEAEVVTPIETPDVVVEKPEEEAIDQEEKSEEVLDQKDDEEGDDQGWSFLTISIWGIAIVLFVGLLGIIGYFVYQEGVKSGEQAMEQKIKSMPTPTIEATPTPEEIDKAKYDIKVLNGSGIAGEASKAKGLLTTADYSVASVGNADTSDFTDTVIAAKKDVEKGWIDQIKKVLGKTYIVSATVDELSEGQVVDVVITVGSTKAE